jgi:iron complex outermembrane receptor protein
MKNKRVRRATLAGTVMMASAAVTAPAVAAVAVVDFRIPAQSAQTALTMFARQSGLQILFPYDALAGVQTRAIMGRMAPATALSRLITGTGLKINKTSGNVIALSLVRNQAMLRPTASAVVPTQAVSAEPAPAGQDAPVENTESETVVVTGSRGLPRTVVDSPTPIDVISSTELERTGKPGVLSALNTLVPSFNVPTRAGGGSSTVISTGGLRGLNPDQTLILVNGKRRHKTSLINAVSTLYNGSVPADLDMIPTSAIDHIEVLRDGAAAQYGSDAIAGVINIILKSKADGGAASFTAGQNMDRSDGEIFQGQFSYGTKIGEGGVLNVFVSAKKQKVSNRANPIDPGIQLYNLVSGTRDPREATIDRLVTKNYGAFPTESINTGYNFHYDTGTIEVYSFGTFSQRDSELNYSFRAPLLTASNTAALPGVYPNGFRPEVHFREQDFEFAVGAKGQAMGWNWDLSTTYGKNRAAQDATNTINASLGPTSPTSFYMGTLRSTEWVNSLDVTKGYTLGGGNLQVSAGLQHRLEFYGIYPGEPASYANGNYTYVINGTTIVAQPGGQSSVGFQPGDTGTMSRNNVSGYIDLAYDPTPDTTIGAAVRAEHYDDDSGNTVIGKVNFRHAFASWMAVRGAASTGFRAPGIAQQIYASTTAQNRLVNGVIVPLQIKTLPVGSAAALALGSSPLQPEKSTSFSGGIVLTPVRNLSITVDGYQIKLKDRIAITSTLTGTAISDILIANGIPSNISAQYYTNAIDTRTRGLDIVATYRHDVGSVAKMAWNVGYNYNETIITKIAANPAALSSLGAGYQLFDRASQSNLTDNLPRTKLYVGNLTSVGPFSLNSRIVHYGGFDSLQNGVSATTGGVTNVTFPNDRHFGGKWITDMEFSWNATRSLTVAIGANNLFNVYPDDVGVYNANLGSGQYPTTSPTGFTGGFYYGRLAVTF